MSDALPNDAIEARAADWLARQQFESWNEADAERLEAWLAESDNHTAAYWRLKAAFGRTDRLAALRRPMMQRAASQASALRLQIATRAPARASCSAIDLPIPRVAPVTSATFPDRSKREVMVPLYEIKYD